MRIKIVNVSWLSINRIHERAAMYFLLFFIVLGYGCSKPRISLQIEPKVLLFENAEIGTWVEDTIHLTNTGRHPITSLKVDNACNCTFTSTLPSLIKPKETVEFHVRFDAPMKVGSFKKNIHVSADGIQIVIPVIGNATKTFDIIPKVLAIEIPPCIALKSVLFYIKNYTLGNFITVNAKIKSLTQRTVPNLVPPRGLDITLIDPMNSKQLFGKIDCWPEEFDFEVPFNGEVMIQLNTSDRKTRTLHIPLKIEHMQKIRLYPKLLLLKYNSAKECYNPSRFLISSSIPIELKNIRHRTTGNSISFNQYEIKNEQNLYFETFVSFTPHDSILPPNIKFGIFKIDINQPRTISIPFIIKKIKGETL